MTFRRGRIWNWKSVGPEIEPWGKDFTNISLLAILKSLNKGQSNCEVCLKEWSGWMKAAVK